jgi:hypothetical protein
MRSAIGLQRFGFGAAARMWRYCERGRAEVGSRVGDTMGCYPDAAGFFPEPMMG